MSTTESRYPEIVRGLAPHVWRIYRQVLDVFLPPRCAVCNKVGTWLCDQCAQQIPLFDAQICPQCGRPANSQYPCRICQDTPLHVAPIRAAYLFEGNIRDVIHVLKYRGARKVADVLGTPMATAWRRHAMRSDVLIPVPLHPDREIQRGYNQAVLIAKALGREIGIPVLTQAVVRARATATQTKLNRQERRANVSGAFTCIAGAAFVGKQVTLVDDVATTGATLNACADVLLAKGAQSVSAFTLARAP